MGEGEVEEEEEEEEDMDEERELAKQDSQLRMFMEEF